MEPFFSPTADPPRGDRAIADRILAYLEAHPEDQGRPEVAPGLSDGVNDPSADRPGFLSRLGISAGRSAVDDTLFGQAYQQWLRGQGYDPAVLASRVPERFVASPYLAAEYRRMTEDRGVQPLPGGQVARRAIDAMGPAERDRYASDWERLDAREQAAFEAMSAPARAHYASWRADFERSNALPPAETTAEEAADLLGALIASAASPEGLVGFVPPAVNGLAIVKQAPRLAQQLTDLVNATVQSVRNRLGRNALPEEIEAALRNSPVYRVWGDGSGPWGRSWTRVDPKHTPDYRDLAGLPDENSGRFLSSGTIRDATGISRKNADPLHGNRGGLDELLIPEPESKIDLHRVEGLNPEF